MKKILSLTLALLMFMSAFPLFVFAEENKIEYDSETFGHIPSETFYIDGSKYEQYMVLNEYQGLTEGDIIYVDSNNNLVTDRQLLEKLVYTSIIKSNIVIGSDLFLISNTLDDIIPALDIINDLGNNLIEKTISSAIYNNFKGIMAIVSGNAVETFGAYADFISSAGIESTLYLSYLINLYSLKNLCIDNLEILTAFNDAVGRQVSSNGLSYEDAKEYEDIVRNCIGVLKAMEDYTIYLAQCVSGDGINNSIDALDVLINIGENIEGDILGEYLSFAYTENIADIIGFCSGFEDLFNTTFDSLGINEKIEIYYNAYNLYDETYDYFIDINDIINNVAILTEKDPSNSSSNNNSANDTISGYNGSNYSSNAEIASRINAVFYNYHPGNSYFTKNGKSCSCHTDNSFSCLNSPSACNCLRYVNINGNSVDLLAVQCFGYARYWQQMLFGSHEANSSNFKKISGVSGTLNATNTKNWFVANKDSLHPGTHIRVYYEGHSIILLGVDYVNGTITYIQSNWVNQSVNYGNWCKVSDVITKTWKDFASTFATLNYAQVYKNYNTEFSETISKEPIATDFNATIKDGIYTLKIAHSSGTMLNVYGGTYYAGKDGTPLTTWSKDGTADQQFYFKHESNGKYHIYAVCSDKSGDYYKSVVDVNVGSNGVLNLGDIFNVWTEDASWNNCQLFYIVPIGDGKYVIELASKPNAVLAAKNESEAAKDGGEITLSDYSSASTQQWYFYDETGTTQVDPSNDYVDNTNTYYTGTYKVSANIGLNIRNGVGTSYDKLAALTNNTAVTVVQIDKNWGKITYNGITGWICLDYTTYTSPLVSSVAIETAPTKTSYYVGDTLSLDGLTLKVTYSDNTSETVSEGFTCATSTLTVAGKQTVSVEYEGKTVSFEITVSEKVSNATTIKIGEAETSAGKTVSVDISIEKNPGVAVLSMTLNYDKTALTLKDVKNGEIFSSLDSDVNLFWSADSDSTEDGVLATLTFEVNENAEAKDYVISARINEAINENYEDQVFSVSNGKITVYDFIYGDVNGDGEVGAADVLMLRKYMANYDYDTNSSTIAVEKGADANGDGEVGAADVLMLRKYMANYDYDTGSSTVVLGPRS